MLYIKKIRIKNFRSLIDETICLEEVNYFVGKNDCGKSNVLKALNLFFNNETDFDTQFNFKSDYSKFAKETIRHAKEIIISLDIMIPDTFRDSGIKTWTKIWRKDGLYSDNISKLFKDRSRGITFLNRINYMYIPAIKSREYFKFLLSQVYLSMTQTVNSALKDLNEQYSLQLGGLTQTLSLQLKKILKINSSIQMPKDLNTLFRDLTFSTSDNYVKDIDLDQRGDGIKARHIPSILRYMQKNVENGRPKKSVAGAYIWGFEEPENGVEYMASFEMSDELYSYKDYCQILITTHSPAFYIKSKSEQAKCFYVHKCDNGNSQYEDDLETSEIDDKIGFLPLVAPYIMKEHEKYANREKELNNQIEEIRKEYTNKTNKIVLITEGKTDSKHLRTAFRVLALEEETLKNIEYYDFQNKSTLGDDLKNLLQKLSKIPKDNIIIGIFDRDKYIEPCEEGKNYREYGMNVFGFNIPCLNNEERKSNDKICIEHYYSNDEIKMITPKGHLYLGKDFNKHGLSSDNLFVFTNFAKNQEITEISIIDGNNKHIQAISDDAKIITKNDFAEYVEANVAKFSFSNFGRIFDIIKQIREDVCKKQDDRQDKDLN